MSRRAVEVVRPAGHFERRGVLRGLLPDEFIRVDLRLRSGRRGRGLRLVLEGHALPVGIAPGHVEAEERAIEVTRAGGELKADRFRAALPEPEVEAAADVCGTVVDSEARPADVDLQRGVQRRLCVDADRPERNL